MRFRSLTTTIKVFKKSIFRSDFLQLVRLKGATPPVFYFSFYFNRCLNKAFFTLTSAVPPLIRGVFSPEVLRFFNGVRRLISLRFYWYPPVLSLPEEPGLLRFCSFLTVLKTFPFSLAGNRSLASVCFSGILARPRFVIAGRALPPRPPIVNKHPPCSDFVSSSHQPITPFLKPRLLPLPLKYTSLNICPYTVSEMHLPY